MWQSAKPLLFKLLNSICITKLLTNNLVLQGTINTNSAAVVDFHEQVEAFRAQYAAAISILQVSLVDKQ
jgi:hypothetical protein